MGIICSLFSCLIENMNVDGVGRVEDMVEFTLEMRSDVTCRARLKGLAAISA